MNEPVLVLQHVHLDGPAFLGEWLARHSIPFEVRNSEAGDAFPGHLEGFGALAILGGPMSANDDLPSLRQAERLVREAVERDLPTIGHCLGGQLMARALGARVRPSRVPEVGWQHVDILATRKAREWFGVAGSVTVFQWHQDAFELPPRAEALAVNDVCPQAFALGPHLALQFHVEIDREKLERWSITDDADYARWQRDHPETVQEPATMRADAASRMPMHQMLADRLYRRWLRR
jgi:GMP synthase-like glutamine amidotransferase